MRKSTLSIKLTKAERALNKLKGRIEKVKSESRKSTFEYFAEYYELGLISEEEFRIQFPGQRVEIKPAVISLWDFGTKSYIERVDRS